ncbi:hypothetical protein Tco_0076437, partial [Tanacetum coccineum]
MHVIEQPLPPAPEPVAKPAFMGEWTALYDAHTEIACLMLGTGVEKFDVIQSFYACKQEEGKPVADYVLKIKGYVEKLEHLGYKANKKSLKAKGKNKVNGKGKDKKVYILKPKNPKPTAMEHPAKDDACHHCKE